MELEKGIRAQHLRPYPQGHWEPPTKSNATPVILDTSQRCGQNLAMMEPRAWPEKITLRLLWRKAPLQALGTTVQVVTSQEQFARCNFYDPKGTDDPAFATHAASQAVELLYQGLGAASIGGETVLIRGMKYEAGQLDIGPEGLVYTKAFKVQDAQSLVLRRTRINPTAWLVTPPLRPDKAAVNLVPLISYGGYCKPSCRLADIEQVYARITYKDKRTSLELKGQSYLAQKGIAPPLGGTMGRNTYQYMEPITPEDTLSLAGLLQTGAVKIRVMTQDETRVYASIGFQQEDQKTQLFDGIFVPT